MANSPLRRKPEDGSQRPKPKIWSEGRQRPPFDIRALCRVSLYFSRLGVAPLHGWMAATARRVAVNVKNGAGRIPEEKLGRVARFVPSHLQVAAWIKNVAVTFAHASASADPDVKRGNAIVARIEPHLWADVEPDLAGDGGDRAKGTEPEPVVLVEPTQQDDDPLASIRNDLSDSASATVDRTGATARGTLRPSGPPAPSGQATTLAIQMIGYGIGWGSSFAAFPYGLVRALWLFANGQDLRRIGLDD